MKKVAQSFIYETKCLVGKEILQVAEHSPAQDGLFPLRSLGGRSLNAGFHLCFQAYLSSSYCNAYCKVPHYLTGLRKLSLKTKKHWFSQFAKYVFIEELVQYQ